MRYCGRWSAALPLLFLCNAPAGAQTIDRAAAFGRLVEGATVRIQSVEGRFEGYLASSMVDTLGLWGTNGTLSLFPYARIDSLWVRGRPRSGSGALIGAIAGVLPVAIVCAQELDECGLLPGGILLPAFGAGIGFLIGSNVASWRLHFPTRPKGESRSW